MTISEEFQKKYEAWKATASDDERRTVDAMLQRAHEQALAAAESPAHPPENIDHRQLAFALSSVSSAPPPIVDRAQPLPAIGDALRLVAAPPSRAVPSAHGPLVQRAITTADGAIVGHGKFEALDPGWLRAAGDWLEKHPLADVLSGPAQEIAVPDKVSFGVLGDWGTGYWELNSPAQGVASVMQARGPVITLHLGDEYYSGEAGQEATFAKLWPPGSLYAFALNSNHAMYSGAQGFLEQTLAHPTFAAQKRTSYFCLHNTNWLFLGLDSAYEAPWISMYMHGKLERLQKTFIAAMVKKYPNRRVVVFTHHQPFGLDLSSGFNDLWNDVTGALGKPPAFWYFGHAHAAVAYVGIQGCYARCAGHGAIPYSDPTDLMKPTRDGKIDWYEHTNAADPRVPERCLNGGLMLEFEGTALRETFFDENGRDRKTYAFP
jgi:hypothetical protein